MYARMATFEIPPDTPPERGERIAEGVRRRITGEGGPEGARHMMILVEPDRNRALSLALFDTREYMEAAEPFFEAMTPPDPETSGRRVDVGHFEVLLDQPVAAATA